MAFQEVPFESVSRRRTHTFGQRSLLYRERKGKAQLAGRISTQVSLLQAQILQHKLFDTQGEKVKELLGGPRFQVFPNDKLFLAGADATSTAGIWGQGNLAYAKV